jgi:hypothetical protein
MSYSPVIGFSASISVNDGASNAQQIFAEPVMIQVPFGDVSAIDVSYMGQSSRSRLKIPGLIDMGNLSFEGIFKKADYLRLVALKAVLKTWILTAPDTGETSPTGLTWTCSAFISKVEMSLEFDGLVKFKAEATLSGDITMGT